MAVSRLITVSGAVESQIVGRDDELEVIEGLFRGREAASSVLVIEGDPGIGKTTLWLRAVRTAGERGRVLLAAPAETEADLSFAALADLIAESLEEVAPALPIPQARALDIAIRRSAPRTGPVDQYAVRAGFLGALRALAGQRPLVVALDDTQWLDRPSELALAFAVRRLHDEPIAFVVARRHIGAERLPLGLERSAIDRHIVRLTVGPLSLGATHRLLLDRLDASISRPVLRRIYSASGGNPFFALEIGRALLQEGTLRLAADDPVPVPADLDDAIGARLADLSPGAREVIVAASSLAQPSVEVLATAYGRRVATSALEEATSLEIIETRRGRVRFVHPLFAHACYGRASEVRRQRVHRVLARTTEDPEERARHLALSSPEPEETSAQALTEAARQAASRGAPEVAAELAELALARTPADRLHERVARMRDAGEYSLRAGDAARARAHFGRAVEASSPGDERAEMLGRLAEAEQDVERALELCESALREPTVQAVIACRIQNRVAWALVLRGNGGRAVAHVRRALELAEAGGDNRLLVATLTSAAEIEYRYGRSVLGLGLLERALALERQAPIPLRESPRLSLARALTWQDRFDKARAIYRELLRESQEHGDEWARLRVLWNLATLEQNAGAFEEAYKIASEGLALAEVAESNVLQLLIASAEAAAALGYVAESRSLAERGLAVADATGDAHIQWVHAVLGFLELSLGNLTAASEHLLAAETAVEAAGERLEATAPSIWSNLIEVMVGLGEIGPARRLLARHDAVEAEYRFPPQLALAARCRGLVLAAEGDVAGGLEAFADALREHARAANAFERSRTLLCYGASLRRAKRRGQARTVLQEALAEFERMAAPLWAAKARAEVGRIGGRRRANGLTESERRVAELVAEGRSNKEIAAALFVTPKTVSTVLSRVYGKLGIHSRAELVRFVLEGSKL